jgi:carbon-monoxide dehydrogenase medium subunit
MFTINDYIRGRSLEQVLAVLADTSQPMRVLAGGTDLIPRIQPDSDDKIAVVDIGGVGELEGISGVDGGLRIGAATKLADISEAQVLSYDPWQVLAVGASLVGSPQIRNLATLGGNICNASPSADTIPPLLVLDAQVELASVRGTRSVALADFFIGPGKSILEADEILSAVIIPKPAPGSAAVYLKHSPRRAMDLAVVGVGARLAKAGDGLEARIALGAVAPTPLRVLEAERLLQDAARLDEDLILEAARLAAEAAKPISDVRASAEYRVEMVRVLARRALLQLSGDLS